MPTYDFTINDDVIKRAAAVESRLYVEVGFVPDDKFGCKIVARLDGDWVQMLACHSRIYGCTEKDAWVRLAVAEDLANTLKVRNESYLVEGELL